MLAQALTRLANDSAAPWGGGRIGFACNNQAVHLEVLTMLLDAGESPELIGPLYGKLGGVVKGCDFLRRFMKFSSATAGGAVYAMAYTTRCPAICPAAANGNLVALKLLIDRGADIHGVGANPTKFTALHHAACRGHADAVSLLLAAGARTDLKDFCGRTPADIARKKGNSEIRQMLVSAAAEKQPPIGSQQVVPPAPMVTEVSK